jgi:hypothetical protein
MRIFIQLDDLYPSNPNVLEPLLLDLIAMATPDAFSEIELPYKIYIVSSLPNPSSDLKVEWVEPKQAASLASASNSTFLIHFGPVADWGKNMRSFFIPLSLPHLESKMGWFKTKLEDKKFNKTLQAASQVVALDEWHVKNRPGAKRVAIENAPLPNFEWSQLAPIRSALTDGNQYLIAFVETEEIVTIVKSFSIFKKWQLSTMSLVFVLASEEDRQKAATLLLGYKYRDAVELVCISDFKLEWIAASYLTIFSKMNSYCFQFLTYSMRYQIPFLLHKEANGPEFILPDMAAAGEYFDFKAPDVLANHLKLYYKDEMYRSAKGVEVEKAVQTEISRFKEKASVKWPRDLVLAGQIH